MNTINFERRNSFRKNFFLKTVRIPTEFQLNTWENEGGCLYGACDDVVIINGVLCETMLDRVKATFKPYFSGTKKILGLNR